VFALGALLIRCGTVPAIVGRKVSAGSFVFITVWIIGNAHGELRPYSGARMSIPGSNCCSLLAPVARDWIRGTASTREEHKEVNHRHGTNHRPSSYGEAATHLSFAMCSTVFAVHRLPS